MLRSPGFTSHNWTAAIVHDPTKNGELTSEEVVKQLVTLPPIGDAATSTPLKNVNTRKRCSSLSAAQENKQDRLCKIAALNNATQRKRAESTEIVKESPRIKILEDVRTRKNLNLKKGDRVKKIRPVIPPAPTFPIVKKDVQSGNGNGADKKKITRITSTPPIPAVRKDLVQDKNDTDSQTENATSHPQFLLLPLPQRFQR
ncbi:hypothetical protein TKK_0002959 [Trichogramma kaykai]